MPEKGGRKQRGYRSLFRPRIAAAYAIVVWILMFGFYDRVIRLFFHEPLMAPLLAGKFPAWIPEWLIL